MQYPEPISKLMDSYMKLPGIGAKTAARLAFFTIDMREEDVTDFAKALISAKRDQIRKKIKLNPDRSRVDVLDLSCSWYRNANLVHRLQADVHTISPQLHDQKP